jgi:uncharacterized protein (TIGR02246 family)
MAATQQMQDVRREIERRVRQFEDAANGGDAAGLAALYTTDARLLPPNHPSVEGRPAIREFWQGFLTMGTLHGQLRPQQIEAHGDTAHEIGAYTLRIEPPDGPAIEDRGKYIVLWKRAPGGDWEMAADCWNSDLPAAGS